MTNTTKKTRNRDTKQSLARKARKCCELARKVPTEQLRVLPFAKAFNVGSATVCKWWDEAGISYQASRGRPKAAETFSFESVLRLIQTTQAQGQENLDFFEADAQAEFAEDADMPGIE